MRKEQFFCLSWLLIFLLLLFLLSSLEQTNGSSTLRTLHNKRKNQKFVIARRKKPNNKPEPPRAREHDRRTTPFPGLLTSTLTSGAGEYLVDVLIGTPPRHFRLIADTGSDLTWIQCAAYRGRVDRGQPYYDPRRSRSFRNIKCRDPRCCLVEPPPELSRPCDVNDHTQTCPYYYFYGDNSNTTGDFAAETFTFNLTSPGMDSDSEFVRVENLAFGCGRQNIVNFHGASGMLGLGRGPLSFSTQLQYRYGNAFSYCLSDPNTNKYGTSKLVFGPGQEISGHRSMNFTSFVTKRPNLDGTFYYLGIESVSVGGEVLNIPKETWEVSPDGSGGTIIDSGTTLSFFLEPAYEAIKQAYANKVKGYKIAEDEKFGLCYWAPGPEKLDMPEFGIVFRDGAEWNFRAKNMFIRFEPDGIACLAMLGIDKDRRSIIGNYQQRNFQVLYDREESRLGFTPMRCAHI